MKLRDLKYLNTLPTAKIHFIEPMYALAVQKLPAGNEWLYEVKFDGYRCLAGRDSTGVTLWSRRGNLFTKQFQHIRPCLRTIPFPLWTIATGVRNMVQFTLTR